MEGNQPLPDVNNSPLVDAEAKSAVARAAEELEMNGKMSPALESAFFQQFPSTEKMYRQLPPSGRSAYVKYVMLPAYEKEEAEKKQMVKNLLRDAQEAEAAIDAKHSAAPVSSSTTYAVQNQSEEECAELLQLHSTIISHTKDGPMLHLTSFKLDPKGARNHRFIESDTPFLTIILFYVIIEILPDEFYIDESLEEAMVAVTKEAEKTLNTEAKLAQVHFHRETKAPAHMPITSPSHSTRKQRKQKDIENAVAKILNSPPTSQAKEVGIALDMVTAQHSKEVLQRKVILESDKDAFMNQKQCSRNQGTYSFIHPEYPFIRSNRNETMVKELLTLRVFPDRITLEEELYLMDNHSFTNRLWLTPRALSIMEKHLNN